MGYLRCHDDGPNVLLGRFVQSTLGDWRIDSVTSIAAIFHSALAFNQDLGWCLDYDVDLSADYVGGAFEKTQCASTSCGVLQGDACAPTARLTPNLTPGPTTAALTGAQVVVEIKAAVVLTGIVADDFNSEPEAQQAFSQSILAHLPRGLIDDGTEITDAVAVSIPGECDAAAAVIGPIVTLTAAATHTARGDDGGFRRASRTSGAASRSRSRSSSDKTKRPQRTAAPAFSPP